MEPEKKYTVIKIQNLKRKNQANLKEVLEQLLVQQLDKQDEPNYFMGNREEKNAKAELYCYKDTAKSMNRVIGQHHNFFNAFYHPYNQHGDILLVPDDVWLMISMFLSKYIDGNAEKLRSQFVKHEGQKELTIIQYADSVEESLKMEKEWDYFFQEIIKAIDKNTVEGVIDALKCDFTTTDKMYELMSTSVIMSSFKKYFTYGRMILGCGINNVYFDGTREDWVKIQKKLSYLNRYDVDGQLKKYIDNVSRILSKFLDTFDNKPDVNWWNTIMTSEERRVGSGSQKDTYIEGWILHFYGIYHKVEIDSIPKTSISVPINLKNMLTKTEKKLELIADWVSVSKVNENTYKPDIGMCIVERSRNAIE